MRYRHCDVSAVDDIRDLMDGAAAETGGIDILFNNAGVNLRGRMDEMPEETWRTVMATNLDSAFLCARAVAR